MKTILLSTLLILLTGILSSVQSSYNENELVGKWKVKKIIRSSGSRKKGEKIITFSADHTYISEDIESHATRNGTWFYDPSMNQLRFKDSDEWEVMDIIKLSNSKLIMKTESKTFKLVKVN